MLTIYRPCGVVVFLLYFIAAWSCVVVSVMLVVCCSLSVFIYMCLLVFCLTVLVNCLLNAFAICVFSLKVIVLFLGCVGVLSSKEYVCCVCDPSVCLDVPSDVVSVFNFVSYVFWK